MKSLITNDFIIFRLNRQKTVEVMIFQQLNGDQRREIVNSRQRHAAWKEAVTGLRAYKGSMVWNEDRGTQYLVRSSYNGTEPRRQKSLGPRSPDTERIKADYERGRRRAKERLAEIEAVIRRQAAINRAVGIGRVPLLGAKIIRALDAAALLGKAIRIVGTHAIYAYEAVAGVFLEADLTTTEDIDLLLDARKEIRIAATEQIPERSLLAILKKIDRSFSLARQTFRAVNREGYLVDLIKPITDPPWKSERERIAQSDQEEDLTATSIEGLRWLEGCPAFEAVAIDEQGGLLDIVAPDPRVFAIHKWWLSKRDDRDAVKKRRDADQAVAVASLVSRYLPHLPYDHKEIASVPREAFDSAGPLFTHKDYPELP